MIMLYRDPKGEGVGNFTPSLGQSGSGPNHLSASNTNGEEKATLLKTLREKEDKINELMLEIKTLKVGMVIML